MVRYWPRKYSGICKNEFFICRLNEGFASYAEYLGAEHVRILSKYCCLQFIFNLKNVHRWNRVSSGINNLWRKSCKTWWVSILSSPAIRSASSSTIPTRSTKFSTGFLTERALPSSACWKLSSEKRLSSRDSLITWNHGSSSRFTRSHQLLFKS